MGLGWHPIYEMEHKVHVWNHQPEMIFHWRVKTKGFGTISDGIQESTESAHFLGEHPATKIHRVSHSFGYS